MGYQVQAIVEDLLRQPPDFLSDACWVKSVNKETAGLLLFWCTQPLDSDTPKPHEVVDLCCCQNYVNCYVVYY